MSAFASHTRDQLRQAYAEAWRKHRDGTLLTPLEAMIADVIGLHPEYQISIRNAESAAAFQPDVAGGAENPFLHMGLHLAVREQISIDRPPGVRDLRLELRTRCGDAHRAEHILMEALAETLWEAQRAGQTPDVSRYLATARRRMNELA